MDFIPVRKCQGEHALPENPKCPNCGRQMRVVRQPSNPNELHTFECEGCHLLFMANDHEPVSGPAIHSSKNL
jgi:transposase-like protein